MFIVEVGALLTTLLCRAGAAGPGRSAGRLHRRHLGLAVVHRALRQLRRGDGRGPRQGPGRHPAQGAPRRDGQKAEQSKPRRSLSRRRRPARCGADDVVLVEAGDIIPGDGEVIEGVASVDESAITGESAPVIRESGGDRSAVTGGTRVLSDWLVVRITANPGETFLDRMIAMVEGAKRQKTPNEIALNILLAALTIIFLLATATLLPFSLYSVRRRRAGPARHGDGAGRAAGLPDPDDDRRAAVGHRHRRHGPHDPGQRDRHVGPGRRSGRRRGRAAAGQDRHDHAGQPPGDGVRPGARRVSRAAGRRRPARLAGRRDAGRAQHRRAGQGEVRPARARRARAWAPISSPSRRRPA